MIIVYSLSLFVANPVLWIQDLSIAYWLSLYSLLTNLPPPPDFIQYKIFTMFVTCKNIILPEVADML